MKRIFLSLAGITAVAAPVVAVVSCGNNNSSKGFSVDKYNSNRNFAASEFKIVEASNNIVDFNNAADINLYFNSWGTITYDYMLKLALNSLANNAAGRTNREVHFAYSPDYFDYQAMMNTKYFETLLKTRNTNSSVINMHDDTQGRITDQWKKIIEQNPNKKINVWWNSDHLEHLAGSSSNNILELAGYKNVNIQLIEDGATISYATNYIDDSNNMKNFNVPQDASKFDVHTQYLAPKMFDNVYSWFSSTAFDKYKSVRGLERIKTFVAKELSDKLFDQRINVTAEDVTALTSAEGKTSSFPAGDQRIFKAWPLVSGLDWKNSLKVLQEATASRNVKNLILLGSYGDDWENDYIRSVWERYHNQYNIFYKGHPGHNEHSDFVRNVLIDSEKKEGMFLIESAIPSEELTRDHFLDGMKFDGIISAGQTSAMDGFPKEFTAADGTKVPGYDLATQYLEIAQPGGPTPNVVGNPTNPLYQNDQTKTAGWPAIENWLKTSGWL